MQEIYQNEYINVYRIISYIITSSFFMIFVFLFLPSRFNKRKSIIICSLTISVLIIFDFLRLYVFGNSTVMHLLISVIQIVLIQLVSFYLSKWRDGKAIFTSLVSSNYVIVGNIIGYIIFIFTGELIIGLICSCLLSLLFLIILVIRIRHSYLELFDNNLKGWEKLSLIPMLFYACFYFAVYYPVTLYVARDRILIVVIMLFTMFTSYILVFNYVDNQVKKNNIYMENTLFQYYIKGLESQYESVRNAEEKLKILRHDMRHYVQLTNSLLKQGNIGEIKKILENLAELTDETKIIKYCENIQVNSIISNYIEKAHLLQIKVNNDILLPDDIPLNSMELAAVIGNLLENAITSVKDYEDKDKEIDIMARYINKKLIIEVKNKCKNNIYFHPVTNLPVSKRGKGHGLGLKSVATFSEKTGANFDCYIKDKTFIVRLLANF